MFDLSLIIPRPIPALPAFGDDERSQTDLPPGYFED